MQFRLSSEKQAELRSLTGRDNAVFYDVREAPFQIYGLSDPYSGGKFCRMPEEIAAAVSPAVKGLNYNMSGGRVRFTTDADYVAVYAEMRELNGSLILNRAMTYGFDLYIDDPKVGGRVPQSTFVNGLFPPKHFENAYSGRFRLPEGEHSVTVNFPLYNSMDALYIGLPEGATLKEGVPYENEKPIVFYGSSITQGAAASRPGLAYTSMVARRLNAHYRNLGFAGAAKAEEAMIEYLASQEMCCFVQDYDHNAPNAEHLRATHEKLYRRVRETHPDIPILLLSRPGFHTFSAKGYSRTDDSIARRDVVIDTFRAARRDGDERVWYIDGESFFSGPDETDCTIDGIHPNDIGMLKMADAVYATMLRILNDVPFLKL